MNNLEKIKALKEFNTLKNTLLQNTLSAVDKIKSLKRFRELRLLLGGTNSQPAPATDVVNGDVDNTNALFQSVIDGIEISAQLVKLLYEEAKKYPDHTLLPQVASIVKEKTIALVTGK